MKTPKYVDVTLRYGNVKYVEIDPSEASREDTFYNGKWFRQVFEEFDYDIDSDAGKRELVEISVRGKKAYQSIEGNGLLWIIKDLVGKIDKIY